MERKIKAGENLKKLREDDKTTQKDLSKRLGISQSYLSKIENGFANYSSLILVKIANLFGITLDDLIYGTNGDD